MKFDTSVLYIVLVPATDYCRHDGVEDIIEQYMMVHIVECSCRIERDEHCSESRQFSWENGRKVGSDRRQCSACRVFLKKAMLSRWIVICVSILGSSTFFSVLTAGHSRLIWRQFLTMLLSLTGYRIRMIIVLCHISGIHSIEIDWLKILEI